MGRRQNRTPRTTRARFHINNDIEGAVAERARYQPLYVRFVETDEEKPDRETVEAAVAALRQRAVAGCNESQLAWGHRLLEGRDVARDLAAAFRWFRIAAGSGNPDAANMVGRCYELGWSVDPDPREAADWYRQAAEKGHAWGAFNLACLLAQGRGVAADVPRAVSLLVRSARGGNAKAMNMLGRYREQAGKNRAAALWYRWAAEGGCFRGQFHHGRVLTTSGQIDDGLAWIRTSLTYAPDDYRIEALDVLRSHPDAALRRLAATFVAAPQRGK